MTSRNARFWQRGLDAACQPTAVPMLSDLRGWALRIKRDALALSFARRRPNTPWLAKLLALVVAAHVLI